MSSDINACSTLVPHVWMQSPNYSNVCTPAKATRVGEIFSMDFGFVKGNVYNRLVRSHKGYSSFLLIVDHKTRYMWVFLTKNKKPPVKVISQFLKIYGLKKGGIKVLRIDQGGKLVKDSSFREATSELGYQVEITGANNSSQNGKVERPHRTLGQMMRAVLTNAGLHPKYWSDILLHSMFSKNRLPVGDMVDQSLISLWHLSRC